MLTLLVRGQLFLLMAAYVYLGVMEIPVEIAARFSDLVAHAIGYVVLMCSGLFAFPDRRYTLRLIVALFIFSFLIECIQYLLPHRSFSLLDLLLNAVGLLIGTGLGWLLLPLFKRIQQILGELLPIAKQ